jgi:multidrug efflux pump subunit AcrB
VASQYQQQLRVVVAKISLPGATADKIEASVARPLEESVVKLSGVKSVKTQSSHGRFLMEVHFKQPAGSDQLAEVKQVIDGFWQGRSTAGGPPTVTLDKASLL